jgi:hypothetical protein
MKLAISSGRRNAETATMSSANKNGTSITGAGHDLERVKGIEPSSKAWEAFVLPLNYTRVLALMVQNTLSNLK